MACSATSKIDFDDDGYSDLDDCNDNDADTFPGADEMCNGFDNNCDGIVDNEAVDGVTLYPDTDGDSFGLDSGAIISCEIMNGFVEVAGDCDDSNSNIHPQATEICDMTETDDDCDGKINLFDESIDMSTVNSYYPDDDRDGYGDQFADVTLDCGDPSTAEQRLVTNNNDCDDSTALAKPGGLELCDGLDNDCDDTTSEDGMVMSVDRSGGRQDRTPTFAAGSPSKSIEYNTIGEESLYFCDGTYYARILTRYSVDLIGVNGASRTVLSAASSGTTLTIQGTTLDVTVQNLSIEGGQASPDNSEFIEYAGGGIYCGGVNTLTLTDSVVANNYAKNSGGGLHSDDCNVSIEGTQFYRNEAQLGAGITNFGGTVSLNESSVSNNEAEVLGGGLYVHSMEVSGDLTRPATVVLTDSMVYDNAAGYFGGGIAALSSASVTCDGGTGTFGVYQNSSGVYGGGIFVGEDSDFSSNNCDFGTAGTDSLPNTEETVYVEIGNAKYDFEEDATFSCTDTSCK